MDASRDVVGIFGGSGFYTRVLLDFEPELRKGGTVVVVQGPHVFSRNLDRLRALLFRAVPKIGPQPECVCASALGSAVVQ